MLRRTLAAAAIAVAATVGAGAASAQAAPVAAVSAHGYVTKHHNPTASAPKSVKVGHKVVVKVAGFKARTVLTVTIAVPHHKPVVKHVHANAKGAASTPAVKVTRTGKAVVTVTGKGTDGKKHTLKKVVVVKK